MKICLISCNIRFDNPSDGNNDWTHRKDFLTQILLKHSPDIIVTQEGRFSQLKELETLLTNFKLIDQHRSWMRERMYPSIYLRNNKFEILGSEDLWLSETPNIAGSLSFESTFPRLMTWVKVQPKDSEENLLIVNTHLDHVRPETRVHQVKVLVQEVKRFWKGDCPLIICGDFNESPSQEVRAILIKEFAGIQDAWKLFNNFEESSHHAFKGTCPDGSRIDWIMVDQRAKVESCFMEKEFRAHLYPTDHYPVICSIEL